jgi:hypothetical protein
MKWVVLIVYRAAVLYEVGVIDSVYGCCTSKCVVLPVYRAVVLYDVCGIASIQGRCTL